MKRALLSACLFAASGLGFVFAGKSTKKPVILRPRFATGQMLRYQFEFRRESQASAESPIIDSNAAEAAQLSLSITLRLEALDAAANTRGRPVRLRAIYEHVVAKSSSSNPTTDETTNAKQIAALQGKSSDCDLDIRGAINECTDATMHAPAGVSVRDVLSQVLAAASLPEKGIFAGQSWGAERPEAEIPLVGLSWVQKSSYARNEPCAPQEADSAVAAETCAVIRTQSLLAQKDKPKDLTPDAFRVKSLRTGGTAGGASESFVYISLATGLVVRAMQSAWQKSDVLVTSLAAGTHVRNTTNTRTESHLFLLREP